MEGEASRRQVTPLFQRGEKKRNLLKRGKEMGNFGKDCTQAGAG
jgi:hypothetical protein